MLPATWSPPRGLEPTPDQARTWLRQELSGWQYRQPWLESLSRWILDRLRILRDGASHLAGLSPVATIALALVVVAALVYVVPRVRRSHGAPASDAAVLVDLSITARFYRDLAEQAHADGRYDDAVLDGFRAIAKDMCDRTLLDDAPSRTAHEVATALASYFPDHADRLAQAGDAFDSVRYGHRGASARRSREVRELDADLAVARPGLAASPLPDLTV